MKQNRNYNLNRPIDKDTAVFEISLKALCDVFGVHMETATFWNNGNEVIKKEL